jgi:hypothetical protein
MRPNLLPEGKLNIQDLEISSHSDFEGIKCIKQELLALRFAQFLIGHRQSQVQDQRKRSLPQPIHF